MLLYPGQGRQGPFIANMSESKDSCATNTLIWIIQQFKQQIINTRIRESSQSSYGHVAYDRILILKGTDNGATLPN